MGDDGLDRGADDAIGVIDSNEVLLNESSESVFVGKDIDGAFDESSFKDSTEAGRSESAAGNSFLIREIDEKLDADEDGDKTDDDEDEEPDAAFKELANTVTTDENGIASDVMGKTSSTSESTNELGSPSRFSIAASRI